MVTAISGSTISVGHGNKGGAGQLYVILGTTARRRILNINHFYYADIRNICCSSIIYEHNFII